MRGECAPAGVGGAHSGSLVHELKLGELDANAGTRSMTVVAERSSLRLAAELPRHHVDDLAAKASAWVAAAFLAAIFMFLFFMPAPPVVGHFDEWRRLFRLREFDVHESGLAGAECMLYRIHDELARQDA